MINTPTKWSTSDCQAAYQKFCTALFCIVLNFAQFCIVFRLICASFSFVVITLPCWMLLWGRVHHWWHFLENLPLSSFPIFLKQPKVLIKVGKSSLLRLGVLVVGEDLRLWVFPASQQFIPYCGLRSKGWNYVWRHYIRLQWCSFSHSVQ